MMHDIALGTRVLCVRDATNFARNAKRGYYTTVSAPMPKVHVSRGTGAYFLNVKSEIDGKTYTANLIDVRKL